MRLLVKPSDEEIASFIRSEMRVGGHPIKAATEGFYQLGRMENHWLAVKITNECLRNLEDRICALEGEK